MKSEHENSRTDGAAETKHQTWFGHIMEEIEGKIENLDTDFPLSGGEEPETAIHDEGTESEHEEAHPKKSSFFHDLETDFPLSGGEV